LNKLISMFQFLAAAFTSVGMLFGGLFGHHSPMGPNASSTSMHPPMSSSTPWSNGHGGMGSTTPWNNGSTTPGHGEMGMVPGVFGIVTAIDGDTLTVSGRTGGSQATTTYTVDATDAKIFKGGGGMGQMQGGGMQGGMHMGSSTGGMMGSSTAPAMDTISVSAIQVNDRVLVNGTITGTSVAAKVIVDGAMPAHMMPQTRGGSAGGN
jgi:hypothetical protein